MSDQEGTVAQQVAKILEPTIKNAVKNTAELFKKDLPTMVQNEMKGLPGIIRTEMDACIDGKCDSIAEKVIAKLPKVTTSMKVEDITTAVNKALENSNPQFSVEGHSAHDILDCPTCKPIVTAKLWENEKYRKTMVEKVCEDEECRNLFLKHAEKKGYKIGGVVEKDESWAERRLRERAKK